MIHPSLIYETLDVVHTHANPAQGFAGILELCHRSEPEAPWHTLPKPDFNRDVTAAKNWLRSEIASLFDANGIYLGLSTLNMRNGKGHSIEIGGSSECDSSMDEIDWLYSGNLDYGHRHLIYGLYELQAVYSSDAWTAAFDMCDYIFFLGYSGVVLTQAIRELPIPRILLVAWGFQDGDLFTLGRKTESGFICLCK